MNMNKRNHQFEILMDLIERVEEEEGGGYDLDEWIDRLNSLDKPSDQFYEMVNVFDGLCKLLNGTQGNAKSILAALDAIMDYCIKYSELYGKEEAK